MQPASRSNPNNAGSQDTHTRRACASCPSELTECTSACEFSSGSLLDEQGYRVGGPVFCPLAPYKPSVPDGSKQLPMGGLVSRVRLWLDHVWTVRLQEERREQRSPTPSLDLEFVSAFWVEGSAKAIGSARWIATDGACGRASLCVR